MAIEAGSLFLDLGIEFQSNDAPPMHVQVEEAKPLNLEDEPPQLAVHPSDIQGVFDWCVEHLEPGWGGPERPALRAMLTLAHRLGKMEPFAELMAQPAAVNDPMLAAVAQACSDSPENTEAWGQRLSELTML
jgi:hypothetical protein